MLKLGENIKRLRSQRELTQEQLADILGVSAQAVSRWENDTTYPDITLLPAIAAYFDVTLDELMGMEDFKSEEQLKAFWEKYNENGSKGLIYENIQLLKEALKLHPNNYDLLSELASQLSFYQYDANGKSLTDEQLSCNRTEAIEICGRILSRCTDPQILNGTIQNMCYLYKRQGDDEKAIEYANKLPCIWNSSTAVFGDIYEGEEKKKHLQSSVLAYAEAMYLSIRNLADLEYKDSSLSTRERIEMLKKAAALFELIFEDKDYFYYSFSLSECYRNIAAMAALEGERELALSSLEKAAGFAVIFDTLPEYANYTSLLIDKLHYNVLETRKNYSFSNCRELYDKMQQDRYDAIHDDKRFIAVLDKISRYC